MTVAANVRLVSGDVTPEFSRAAAAAEVIAWDIETSGLDWKSDRIGTCQILVPGVGVEIVQLNGRVPVELSSILASKNVRKVFHHAPFDLRFMRYCWGVRPQNVACTKIMSKILWPQLESKKHSLKHVLNTHLGVSLDKGEQTSDWVANELTESQLRYASRDVEFLIPLYELLMERANMQDLGADVKKSFDYLPARVETDLRGCGDVFAY